MLNFLKSSWSLPTTRDFQMLSNEKNSLTEEIKVVMISLFGVIRGLLIDGKFHGYFKSSSMTLLFLNILAWKFHRTKTQNFPKLLVMNSLLQSAIEILDKTGLFEKMHWNWSVESGSSGVSSTYPQTTNVSSIQASATPVMGDEVWCKRKEEEHQEHLNKVEQSVRAFKRRYRLLHVLIQLANSFGFNWLRDLPSGSMVPFSGVVVFLAKKNIYFAEHFALFSCGALSLQLLSWFLLSVKVANK